MVVADNACTLMVVDTHSGFVIDRIPIMKLDIIVVADERRLTPVADESVCKQHTHSTPVGTVGK